MYSRVDDEDALDGFEIPKGWTCRGDVVKAELTAINRDREVSSIDLSVQSCCLLLRNAIVKSELAFVVCYADIEMMEHSLADKKDVASFNGFLVFHKLIPSSIVYSG